jgi:hypothetical protein
MKLGGRKLGYRAIIFAIAWYDFSDPFCQTFLRIEIKLVTNQSVTNRSVTNQFVTNHIVTTSLSYTNN